MRRLYLQIYATIVAVLLLLGAVTAAIFAFGNPDYSGLAMLEALAARLVPPATASREVSEDALRDLARELGLSFRLHAADGTLVTSVDAGSGGVELPSPDVHWTSSRFLRSRGAGLTAALRLPDGRWLVVRHPRDHHPGGSFLVFLLLAGTVVAVGSYPIVRRLTGRLERLQRRVEALGTGDLEARVEVEGSDEVADLARSFNRTAARLESLVEAQRVLLAGASHELRSPLTRVRMAIELMQEQKAPRPELMERIVDDIAELDALIDQLLLLARVEASDPEAATPEVDLEALVAEEAARHGARPDTTPVRIRGDAVLLRRMVRNLLQNARLHGAHPSVGGGEGTAEVEIELRPKGPDGGAVLRVKDRGPGISPPELARVFEAFYRGETTSRSGAPGVGLGLALSRRIARLHGGDVTCLAREGGGAVLEVELPG